MITERNSTIECLRIISMWLVVGLHYLNYSIGGGLATTLLVNKVWTHLFESAGVIAVNVFVLISGYFLTGQKQCKPRKAINLYLILVFYNLVFFAVGCLAGAYEFSWKELMYAILPFFDGRKWFLETYILLLLFVPFLNKLTENLTAAEHRALIILQLVVFSVWPSFLPSAPISDRGYGIINFLTLYFIAAYIRRYPRSDEAPAHKGRWMLLFLVSCGATVVSSVLPYLEGRAWDYCYLPNIVGAVAIFCFFLRLRETRHTAVNILSIYCHPLPSESI